MVKVILPNSAPPGQGSLKRLENSATELTKSEVFFSLRGLPNAGVLLCARDDKL